MGEVGEGEYGTRTREGLLGQYWKSSLRVGMEQGQERDLEDSYWKMSVRVGKKRGLGGKELGEDVGEDEMYTKRP